MVAQQHGFVPALLRQATSSASAIRGEAAKVLDLLVNTGDPALLAIALRADIAKGLEIMGQMVSWTGVRNRLGFVCNRTVWVFRY